MRIKFLLLFCTLFALRINAQSNFTGGIIAGGSLSQITGDEAYGYNKPSYLVGVKAGYKFKSRLNLEVEFLYNTKGSARGRQFNYLPYWTMEFNYLEIPLLAGYKDWLSPKGFYHLVFYGGISYSIMLDNKITNPKYKPYMEGNLNEKEWSFILGATYQATKHLGFTGRYNRAITKVWTKDFVDDRFSNWMKNYQISLAAQYMF
ncbi:MAG: PorT family protein [Saprospiraceae bacterium]|nr:PorT family protein [Saprospiraceae bacterium]